MHITCSIVCSIVRLASEQNAYRQNQLLLRGMLFAHISATVLLRSIHGSNSCNCPRPQSINSAAKEAKCWPWTCLVNGGRQLMCDWQVEQRQKEYQALQHGALQRLQQWKEQMLQLQGD